MTALCCLACNDNKTLTVAVTNSLPINRFGEMVELPMAEISSRMNLAATTQIVVLNAEGEEVPYQITYDNNLIFPAAVAANATSIYTIQRGTPMEIKVKSCGRQYPERLDDVAWENDLVGFRVYGPALQATGERGFGYDLFAKYNTSEQVLESFYAGELDHSVSYHIDHGFGMDCYAVGPTLGAGVAALMVNDSIVYPWCYRRQEVLNNGPLRFTVKLDFPPIVVGQDSAVVESRLITLDAGSHLNRTVVSYTNLNKLLPVATGIVLHEPEDAVVADAANGYMTYVDPTTGHGNGKIFVGAVFPNTVKEIKVVLFSEQEKKQRNNADGHVLAIRDYEPEIDYVYYWGFAWNKADIKTADAWNQYIKDFAQKVRYPLVVSLGD